MKTFVTRLFAMFFKIKFAGSLIFFLLWGVAFSQNISINTSGKAATSTALLDVGDGNATNGGDTKGILMPRVKLLSTTDVATISSPDSSLVVFNTNSSMTNGNTGYYYWSGAQWISFGIPKGGIIMWSGSKANIPAGWALCDGTNGTPNLLGSFILGVPVSAYTAGQINTTGGSNTITLSVAQLPAHTFTGTTDATTPTFTGNASTQTFAGAFTGNASTQTASPSGAWTLNNNAITTSIESNGHTHHVQMGNNAGIQPGCGISNSNLGVPIQETSGAESATHTHTIPANSITGTMTGGTVNLSAWTPTGAVTVTPAAWTPTGTVSSHTHTFTTNSVGSGSAVTVTPVYYTLAFIMKL